MPFFLWLLPLTAIPLLIHLLNRRNIITIEFSTLRFLKMLEKESIRKLKLVQLILLILRTIIILLIIIMISRPVLTGAFSIKDSGNSALHAIILDDSASMEGATNIIKKTAISILQQIPDKGQLIWINLNKGLQYMGLKEDMPPLESLIKNTHLSGDVTDGLNVLRKNINTVYTSKEVYILTDSQDEPMKNLWKYSDQYEDMYLYIFLTSPLNNNLAITNVDLLSEILLRNHPIDLEVSVKNTGQTNKENILLQLIVDNVTVGQQLVSLLVEEKQTFLFKTSLPKTGTYRALVALDTDDREGDNKYFFNLNIPDQRNIALISTSEEESYYIHTSMKALNKTGESITIAEYTSLDDPTLKLINHDAVFIISPNIFMSVIDSKIEEYLFNGGHLIIFPGINSKPVDYSLINSSVIDIPGNYKNLFLNELSNNSFQDIDLSSIKIREIDDLFFSATGKDRNIKLFKYIGLPYDPKYSQLLLSDGSAVWNRHNIYSGMIDVFSFAMNLNWSNFPIKGTFLPFIHYIAYSQNGKCLSVNVGHQWKVILEDYYSSTIFHVLPNGSREIINSDENNYLITDILTYPGYHSMETGGEHISHVAANIDSSELNCNYVSIDALIDKAPKNMQIISMDSDVVTEIKEARIGVDIWRYILYLSIILVMIEMLISNVQRNN